MSQQIQKPFVPATEQFEAGMYMDMIDGVSAVRMQADTDEWIKSTRMEWMEDWQ